MLLHTRHNYMVPTGYDVGSIRVLYGSAVNTQGTDGCAVTSTSIIYSQQSFMIITTT